MPESVPLLSRPAPPVKPPGFFSRIFAAPFESGFALTRVFSGVSALYSPGFQDGIFNNVVGGHGIAIMFNVGHALGGLAILCGTGWARSNDEGIGLIVVITSLAVRFVATIFVLGVTGISVGVYEFNIIFIVVCLVRLSSLLQWKVNGEPHTAKK